LGNTLKRVQGREKIGKRLLIAGRQGAEDETKNKKKNSKEDKSGQKGSGDTAGKQGGRLFFPMKEKRKKS